MTLYPRSVQLTGGDGGLPRFLIDSPFATAELFLHGAHLTAFQPKGEEPLLFLSRESVFKPDWPIRGGIPVIFPWFGPGRHEGEGAHGFARRRSWSAQTVQERQDGALLLSLRLDPQPGEGDWVARLHFEIAKKLTIRMEITNTGSEILRCEEALHTYFKVSDVRQVTLHGLDQTPYLSEIEEPQHNRQGADALRFDQEIDRAYFDTRDRLVIEDPGLRRNIVIEKEGAASVVVWNPWVEKSRRLADFAEDEWPGMLCVETGNLKANTLEIAPGERHLSTTSFWSEPLA